jgi:hypothetical protein
MFPRETLRRMRWSVCALGVSGPDLGHKPDVRIPIAKIFGTGFMIREDAVLTARHVVRLIEEHLKKVPPGHSRWIEFVHPAGDAMTQWRVNWEKVTLIENPEYDLAIVGMPRSTSPNSRARSPLPFPDTLEVEVGQEVGAYGFPFGSALMTRDEEGEMRYYRFGAVLQQGHIAAIAPYSDGQWVERLLLDMRTAGAMSGAPVFDPYSSTVIGIHQTGYETVTAFAFPLTKPRVAALLHAHDNSNHGESCRIELPDARRVRDDRSGV